MATYKLIQDIEAEDHIIGPLTLRQFIFALIAAFLFYICFVLVVKHLEFFLVLFLPPALFFGFFAMPFGRDQPTEIWALAKLRFWFKPRKRIWNQSGVKELVTITVPKKVERVLTNGLSQTEVNSRLKILAQTLDSRGWAIKHAIDAGMYVQPTAAVSSDRLIDISGLPQEVPNDDPASYNDVMDETSSPIARQFTSMINQSTQSHRQELMDRLSDVREDQKTSSQAGSANWFLSQRQAAAPGAPMATAAATVPPYTGGASDDVAAKKEKENEAALAAELASRSNSRHVSFNNLRTVQPLGVQTTQAVQSAPKPQPASQQKTVSADQPAVVTTPSDPDILSLAKNNDLNVATLARQASKKQADEGHSPDEVVVSLH